MAEDIIALVTSFPFSGHRQFGELISIHNQVGRSFDATVGRYIPYFNGGWINIGGYFNHIENSSNIKGIPAKVQFNTGRNAELFVKENYDNIYKNVFSVGFSLRFGGSNLYDRTSLANRMGLVIERYLDVTQSS